MVFIGSIARFRMGVIGHLATFGLSTPMKKRVSILPSLLLIFAVVISASYAVADDAPSATPPGTVPNYQVAVNPANIAPTPVTQPHDDIQVFGQPRNSVGHPCTYLDKEDVDDLKKALTTNPAIKAAFDTLKAKADARITKDINVPGTQKAADGSWMWPGDFPKGVSPFLPGWLPEGKANYYYLWKTNEANGIDMGNMGMMYQLTGDEKYGEYAKKMLLAYADSYTHWGHPPGWTPGKYRSAFDGRLTSQFLEDGGTLIEYSYAYDMIGDLPSWTKEERAHMRDDLFKPIVAEFIAPELGKGDYITSPNNRSAIAGAGTLMAGYACEDQDLVNLALYGPGGTKDNPTGGTLKTHFGESGIFPDGLWIEGAPAYQLGIASEALFSTAETLWHHGIDMYRFRGGIMKRLLDSGIALAYPDDNMTVPALHDSGQFSIIGNGTAAIPYQLGYRRYHDPNYLPIIEDKAFTPSLSTGWGPPSIFLDWPPLDTAPPRKMVNANFYAVGYGVLRQPAAMGYNQLLMEYGSSYGHAHPSKLGIDVWALGSSLMPFPGVIYPYNNPLDASWFSQTLSNCDLEIDEVSQIDGVNGFVYERGSPTPKADQLVYGPAVTMGIQRAWSDTLNARLAKTPTSNNPPQPAIIKVTEDRSVFLTPEYLADIFGAFSAGPHKYDLAWHITGDMTTTLQAQPFKFPDPVSAGYSAITNLTHASSDQAWTATITTANKQTVRFLAAGGTPTEVYLGNGHLVGGLNIPEYRTPPVIIQRRADQNNALFGNAVDISGSKDGYLKSVAQEGSLDTGYGLLKLQTAKGTDLCFTAFRPGSYTAGGLTTDAMQAMVRMDGSDVNGMYLGGGTHLQMAGGTIDRSAPGLAYVEKLSDGSYVVGNPSPTPATITVTLAALRGLKAQQLDDAGKPVGPAQVTAGAAGSFSVPLPASSKVEFGPQ
jgi:hypothetical protein